MNGIGTRAVWRRGMLFGVGAAMVCCVPARAQFRANLEVDIDVVYDELASYGEWVSSDAHGWVWVPADVSPGWRPYTHGRWTYCNEYGWVWRSSWEWGWAPFHYGRWYFDPFQGWAWVPGTEWGPAWVAWRSDGDHVGWAPLPPKARWRAGFGLDLGGLNIDVEIGPSDWSFVEARYILEPELRGRVILPARNVTLIRRAPLITRYVSAGDRVVNLSLSVERIERAVRRPVPRLQFIATSERPSRRSVEGKDRANPTLEAYRPRIVRRDAAAAPRVLTRRPGEGAALDARRAMKQRLEDQYREDARARLEAIHRREAAGVAREADRESILKRQAAERRALDEEHTRRVEQLKRLGERERAGRPSPAGGERAPKSPAVKPTKPTSKKSPADKSGESKSKPTRKKKDKD